MPNIEYILFNEKTKKIYYANLKNGYDYILSADVFLNKYMIEKPKEEPKEEEYIVLDQNCALTLETNSISIAEEHIKNRLESCNSNEFTIYKKIKSAKGSVTVNVEWSE